MNPLLRKIIAASRLTRQGRLADATALIQRALAPAAEPRTQARRAAPEAEAEIVDAEVVEVVDDDGTADAAEAVEIVDGGGAVVEGDADDVVEGDEPAPSTVADVRPAKPARRSAGRFVASSFTGADGTRGFKVFVPAGFEGEALPLVVMLHGCSQDPDDFAAGTRMNALAQEVGFVVLYPEQGPRSNAHKCWNWFSPRDQGRGAGEPALLAGMTRHILQTHSIDHDRVFVAGLSAGGAMAAILAREYADVFAAAGVHSGVAPGAAHDVQSAFAVMSAGPGGASDLASALMATLLPSAAPPPAPAATSRPGAPLIVFHGDADRTVVAANGDTVVAAALGDQPAVATSEDGRAGARSFRRTVWRRDGAAGDAPSVVEHWVVHGGGHAWAGGSAAGSFADPDGPDATREMLRFFAEHPRRARAESGGGDQTND